MNKGDRYIYTNYSRDRYTKLQQQITGYSKRHDFEKLLKEQQELSWWRQEGRWKKLEGGESTCYFTNQERVVADMP